MSKLFTETEHKEHEEFLNSVYKDIEIGPLTFKAGEIIRTMDYEAFKSSFYAIGKGALVDGWRCTLCKFKKDAKICCRSRQ